MRHLDETSISLLRSLCIGSDRNKLYKCLYYGGVLKSLTLLLLVSSILMVSGSTLDLGAPFFQRQHTSNIITIISRIGQMTAGIIHHLIGVEATVGGSSEGVVGTNAGLGAVRT